MLTLLILSAQCEIFCKMIGYDSGKGSKNGACWCYTLHELPKEKLMRLPRRYKKNSEPETYRPED